MRHIKLTESPEKIDFKTAHDLANEKARAEIGDCMTISYYNGKLKLMSPWDVKCAVEGDRNCGAESYANAFEAALQIDVGENFQFFYRQHDHEYIS